MSTSTSTETAPRAVSKSRRTGHWPRWSANFSLLAASVATFVPGLCSGEGFRNSPAGAFNLGRAGGRITQVGTHDELIRAGGTYAELFEIQARAYR